eukprot:TRINITY_DN6438_c2_g1_i2.p1 TRINITY_DN6438_c2_g1~~TRINITY_DN6438_c2_g1_i2.p1  ORF type:complete len:713 (+),score=182.75 TRINITY_DN6438_c2_g1_i2:51-2189(+)
MSVQLGRNRKLQVATCFAVDRNGKLLNMTKDDLADRVEIVTLNAKEDLHKQIARLEVKPDVILSKMHKALGSADEESKKCIDNYNALLESDYGETFKRINMMPLECEKVLVDRYSMVGFLKRVTSVVVKANAHGCACDFPKWLSCVKGEAIPDHALPPFPIVVKPKSTAIKQMGVVFNKDGLYSFMKASEGTHFSLEQYVPHSGTVYKIYVVGKHIFVGCRPSLPDFDPSLASLQKTAHEIQGTCTEYTTTEECSAYITFCSNIITNRIGKVDCKTLYDHAMQESGDLLEFETVSYVREAIQSEWGIDLFGFDVLVDKNTKEHYIVDINVLPGYKGVDRFLYHINKLFLAQGEKHAVSADVAQLRQPDVLRQYCVDNLPQWRDVAPATLDVACLYGTPAVKISHGTDTVLATFYDPHQPERRIHDEKSFLHNISKALDAAGVTPLLHTVEAGYFGRGNHLGCFSTCLSDSRTLAELLGSTGDREKAFSALGRALYKFHSVIENEGFQEGARNHHFEGMGGVPECFMLLETWRRKCLMKGARVVETAGWREVVEVLEGKDVETAKKVVLREVKSKHSTQVVLGHCDLTFEKVLVKMDDTEAALLSPGFCGPDLVVCDFARVYTRLMLVCAESEADILLRAAVTAYFSSKSPQEPIETADIDVFVSDCKAFIPIVSILGMYKALLLVGETYQDDALLLQAALEECHRFKACHTS